MTRARPKTRDHSPWRYTKDSGIVSTRMQHKHQHPFRMLDATRHSTNAFSLVPNRSSCCFHAQCPRCVRKRCTRAHLCARGCLALRLRCDGERCWHISTRRQETRNVQLLHMLQSCQQQTTHETEVAIGRFTPEDLPQTEELGRYITPGVPNLKFTYTSVWNQHAHR